MFAGKTSRKTCIEYCGFYPDMSSAKALNLPPVSNPIIILRITWIQTLMTEDQITHMLWFFILLKSKPSILPLLSGLPSLPRAEQSSSLYLQDLLPNSSCPALNKGLIMLKNHHHAIHLTRNWTGTVLPYNHPPHTQSSKIFPYFGDLSHRYSLF